MGRIARQVGQLVRGGRHVTIVSSGAIAVGRKLLGLASRPTDTGVLQAVAAVGQNGLMERWAGVFARQRLTIGQMLVTRGDFERRARYLNIRNCIAELHALNIIPIVNENDTVAVDEIRFGDNDVLAALLASAIGAQVLVLLSVVDGLHDAGGRVVEVVEGARAIAGLVRTDKSSLGSGGMGTKVEAARLVTEAGEAAVIAGGREPNVLTRVMSGENIGTLFVPGNRRLDSRRRWIGQAVRPAGVLVVDEGAARAVAERGKSLLASGVRSVSGAFAKGDVVAIRDESGSELARGLTNYDAAEVRLIMGKRSTQFEKLLGRKGYDEIVHRDHMVLTGSTGP